MWRLVLIPCLFIGMGQACGGRKQLACVGTAPFCDPTQEEDCPSGTTSSEFTRSSCGGSSCSTGKKLKCYADEDPCTCCASGQYVLQGKCVQCDSCSSGQIRINCGPGSNAGSCIDEQCLDMISKPLVCPPVAVEPCFFSMTFTSSSEKTTSQVASFRAVVQVTASMRQKGKAMMRKSQTGTVQVGHSQEEGIYETFMAEETSEQTMMLRPGGTFCQFQAVTFTSTGHASCSAPQYGGQLAEISSGKYGGSSCGAIGSSMSTRVCPASSQGICTGSAGSLPSGTGCDVNSARKFQNPLSWTLLVVMEWSLGVSLSCF